MNPHALGRAAPSGWPASAIASEVEAAPAAASVGVSEEVSRVEGGEAHEGAHATTPTS